MNRNDGLGELFGPASLLGVILGTACITLLVFGAYEVAVVCACLLVLSSPIMLISGAARRLGTGVVVSLAAIPFTLVPFLLAARFLGE
ncbi:hypothetical protein [Mycobacterium sp. NAZ190054]|uniref:hypothetical protein n=1 Tax=Mycobacterium sp. NAZ190054 TaxID=1747766 RepID=UPI000798ED06|nr:hypothetical protein [Mycobacterium sp. NAZ190054]KWX65973.1 hypothetical protein ASJ79_27125 [Mycobacterium sp. NAZ190054]